MNFKERRQYICFLRVVKQMLDAGLLARFLVFALVMEIATAFKRREDGWGRKLTPFILFR